jgi:hypothetical protein
MVMTTGNTPELLWPGLKKIYGDTYANWDAVYSKIANVDSTDKYFDKIQGLAGFGAAAIKDEGSSVIFDDIKQGFQKEIVQVAYGLGAKVTMEMMRFDQYGKMNKIPAGLARAYRHTQEIIVADQFNRGFTTATTADNVAIFSTAHLLVGGGTFRNRPTVETDLTMGALEQCHTDVENYNDDRGLPVMTTVKKLMVSSEGRLNAEKILGTDYALGTNNNDINVVANSRRSIELIVNPYLTDADAWFALTSEWENGIQYLESVPPSLERDNVHNTRDLEMSHVGMFGVAAVDPRAFWGTQGA